MSLRLWQIFAGVVVVYKSRNSMFIISFPFIVKFGCRWSIGCWGITLSISQNTTTGIICNITKTIILYLKYVAGEFMFVDIELKNFLNQSLMAQLRLNQRIPELKCLWHNFSWSTSCTICDSIWKTLPYLFNFFHFSLPCNFAWFSPHYQFFFLL